MSDKVTPALWAMAIFTAVNGAVMTTAPETWYATTPGVSHTGPFNPHFIRDIGFTFISMAVAYGAAARDRVARPTALLIAAVWMGLHGLLHLIECLTHPWNTGPRLLEIAFVIIPGVVAILFAVNAKTKEPHHGLA